MRNVELRIRNENSALGISNSEFIYGQTPNVWYDTAILLIAPTNAAVRKVSIFSVVLYVSLIS